MPDEPKPDEQSSWPPSANIPEPPKPEKAPINWRSIVGGVLTGMFLNVLGTFLIELSMNFFARIVIIFLTCFIAWIAIILIFIRKNPTFSIAVAIGGLVGIAVAFGICSGMNF